MKKIFVLLLICFAFTAPAIAAHIKGGFFTYQYLGPGSSANSSRYRITLTVYMQCPPLSSAQVSNPIKFTFFNGGNNAFIQTSPDVFIANRYELRKDSDNPCITGDQRECYYTVVVYDLASIELPNLPNGYTISYQRCCRIAGVMNVSNSDNVGNTWSIGIPGTTTIPNGFINNSPQFDVNDTVVVCAGNYFEYSFQATDPDAATLGDQLTYEFCDAWSGGGPGNGSGPTGAEPNPAAAPPYNIVPYSNGYNGSQPLGSQVTIDANTGLISGIAPPFNQQGEFVVTVCVNESRNGVIFARSRKELHIKVKSCESTKPAIDLNTVTCDGFSRTFVINNPNPEIRTLYWEFGDGATSTAMSPTHTYAAAGDYTIKVVSNRGDLCADSTTGIVKIYPGFFPEFDINGVCLTNPVQFVDRTTTNYGVVDTWRWDFGDLTTIADTSRAQNSQWTYAGIGTKSVRLIVTNSKGCVDTLVKQVNIIDKPPITLAFKDTLICVPDNVQLQASGSGNFSWTPNTFITNANTATPTVNPPVTTTYHVQLDQAGCINTDSVRVRVVNFVTLSVMPDTTICLTDTLQIQTNSDGLRYTWTPAATIIDPTVQDPFVVPVNPVTNYQVTARIGSCAATDNITVRTVPYPVVNAGPDTTICYATPAFLHGSHDGTRFTWSPTSTLLNAGTLNPTAYPAGSGPRPYVLTAFNDVSGCPKPSRDTVVITVKPKIIPFAGNDTAVVVGQPLQFNATGGVTYSWSPATGLNNTTIGNPIGVYPANIDSIRYRVLVFNDIGCVDSSFIKVTVFKTNPYVFVPTGFTPNGDGLNDVVRPIAVGVKEIKYFRVYNRWGQMVFSTTTNGHGWDGRINGAPQASNVFVWMVGAVDYTGKNITLKGTVTLIR